MNHQYKEIIKKNCKSKQGVLIGNDVCIQMMGKFCFFEAND